jgi:steroid delta-isomerase
VPSSPAPSRPVAAKESSRTGWLTGTYLTDGHQLIWEYPRQTPTGEQTHLVECMDIVDGLIARHLVCWGWVGFKKLHAAANNTPPTG